MMPKDRSPIPTVERVAATLGHKWAGMFDVEKDKNNAFAFHITPKKKKCPVTSLDVYEIVHKRFPNSTIYLYCHDIVTV